MDATVATGAAAMMAIRVLLDHEVPEENINLVSPWVLISDLNRNLSSFFQVSLLMAESGVHTIAYAFPKVNIVTTAVDPEINERVGLKNEVNYICKRGGYHCLSSSTLFPAWAISATDTLGPSLQ